MEAGAIRAELASSYFQHRIYRGVETSGRSDSLHIYIEGDGHPWRRRDVVSKDPTSSDAVMLRAMLQDDVKSIYLGRPCYFQIADPRCNAAWWTYARYHEQVVVSMTEVVKGLSEDSDDLWLVGHSGGGTLAVLIARRLERPVKVMTVAANLDHRAWTGHHDYSPLWGSLNPLSNETRNPQMRELHWFGVNDRTILPAWSQTYCERLQVRCIAAQAEHKTGWLEKWPEILEESGSMLAD